MKKAPRLTGKLGTNSTAASFSRLPKKSHQNQSKPAQNPTKYVTSFHAEIRDLPNKNRRFIQAFKLIIEVVLNKILSCYDYLRIMSLESLLLA